MRFYHLKAVATLGFPVVAAMIVFSPANAFMADVQQRCSCECKGQAQHEDGTISTYTIYSTPGDSSFDFPPSDFKDADGCSKKNGQSCSGSSSYDGVDIPNDNGTLESCYVTYKKASRDVNITQ